MFTAHQSLIYVMSVALFLTLGCEEEEPFALDPISGGADESVDSTGGNESDESDESDASDESDESDDCEEPTQVVKALMEGTCSNCHDFAKTAESLIASKRVIRDNPEQSPVWVQVSQGTMPKGGQPLSNDKIEAVAAWIACGAPEFNPIAQPVAPVQPPPPQAQPINSSSQALVARAAYSHLRTLSPSARPFTRFFFASDTTQERLAETTRVLSLAMNNLSRGPQIIKPVPLGNGSQTFAIDLRDYGWSVATWERLEADYPYGTVFIDSGELPNVDALSDEEVRNQTQADQPIMSADWFITRATLAPLYYDLLDFPDTIDGLAADFNINRQSNIDNREDVWIAGMENSGVSQNNRLVESHANRGERAGRLWISGDFKNSVGERNIFAGDPRDLEPDGGEAICTLPNGLFCYFIFDGNGQRVNVAPADVVVDTIRRHGVEVEAGQSCMNCHDSGLISITDNLRAHIEATATGQARLELLELVANQDQINDDIANGTRDYQRARLDTGVLETDRAPIPVRADDYLDGVSIEYAAALAGTDVGSLRVQFNVSGNPVLQRLSRGETIDTDAFEDVFSEIICLLGVGTPINESCN